MANLMKILAAIVELLNAYSQTDRQSEFNGYSIGM